MAAKKKTAKKKAGKGSKKSSPTRCEGGKEILPALLRTEEGDKVVLVIDVCKSDADVRIDVDGATVFEGQSSKIDDRVRYILDPLPKGVHGLQWGCKLSGPDWQTRDQILVNGAVVFRRKKHSKSNLPFPIGYVTLEVV